MNVLASSKLECGHQSFAQVLQLQQQDLFPLLPRRLIVEPLPHQLEATHAVLQAELTAVDHRLNHDQCRSGVAMHSELGAGVVESVDKTACVIAALIGESTGTLQEPVDGLSGHAENRQDGCNAACSPFDVGRIEGVFQDDIEGFHGSWGE